MDPLTQLRADDVVDVLVAAQESMLAHAPALDRLSAHLAHPTLALAVERAPQRFHGSEVNLAPDRLRSIADHYTPEAGAIVACHSDPADAILTAARARDQAGGVDALVRVTAARARGAVSHRGGGAAEGRSGDGGAMGPIEACKAFRRRTTVAAPARGAGLGPGGRALHLVRAGAGCRPQPADGR